jgi:dihydrofolate reductase
MLKAIVATDKNGVIGYKGDMPWGRLPNDLKWFKFMTSGYGVIMGRTTYESIGKKLPYRKNMILSRDLSFIDKFNALDDNYRTASFATNSIDHVMPRNGQTYFVIGGAEIYELFMNDIQEIYITEIDAEFKGDTYFPSSQLDWERTELFSMNKDEENQYSCTFVKYIRRG